LSLGTFVKSVKDGFRNVEGIAYAPIWGAGEDFRSLSVYSHSVMYNQRAHPCKIWSPSRRPSIWVYKKLVADHAISLGWIWRMWDGG
jgi:hypothetical protein